MIERFQGLGCAYFRGADACVLVFDQMNSKSFDNVENWYQEFLLQSKAEANKITFLLVGNKIDLITKQNMSPIAPERLYI